MIRNLDNGVIIIRGAQVRAAQSAMENGRASLAADLERHQREREAMSKEKAAGHAAIAQRRRRLWARQSPRPRRVPRLPLVVSGLQRVGRLGAPIGEQLGAHHGCEVRAGRASEGRPRAKTAQQQPECLILWNSLLQVSQRKELCGALR